MSEKGSRLKKYSIFYIPLLFLITSVVLDAFMYFFMKVSFPDQYAFSLFILLIISSLICLIQRKWLQGLITSILIGAQLFLCISNVIAYSNVGEVFSLESLKSIFNAFIAAMAGNYSIWMLVCMFGTLILFVVTLILICKKLKTPVVKRKIFYPIASFLIIFVCLFSNVISYFNLNNYANLYVDNLKNEKFTYDTFNNRIKNLTTFGSYSYYLNNFLYLFDMKTSVSDALSDTIHSDWVADSFEYENINKLQQGDNLIMILMETFELAAINPITTPNLWDFLSVSTSIDGYSSVERTCMSDYISQTGIHLLEKEMWSNYGNVEVPFSLANIFKRSGYEANAFHNYDKTFYDRGNLFSKALGFDNFYDYKGITPHDSVIFNNNKDEDMFDTYLDKMAPTDKNFYSYIISISTHGLSPFINLEKIYQEEFDFINQNIEQLSSSYPWLVSDSSMERQTIKNYLAGSISFDKGFGKLIERLKTTTGKDGRLLIDSTGIVMFGDHYYYGSPNAVTQHAEGEEVLNGNKSPFIIYNPNNKTPKVIERFASTMDIYKTVCSLFGIVTDTQFTIGSSVLTSADSIGIGYLNGKIWGEDWRTSDLITFAGKELVGDDLTFYKDKANKLFESIIMTTLLYDGRGFKNVQKAYYSLPPIS